MSDEFGPGEDTALEENETPLSNEEVLDTEESMEFIDAVRLGAAEGTAEVLGHTIEFKLMNVDQELEVARIVGDFEGTPGKNRAYKTAVVAACLKSIDEEPFFVPISSDQSKNFTREKFNKLKKYYAIFVDQIYNDVIKKEMQVGEDLLKKLSKSEG